MCSIASAVDRHRHAVTHGAGRDMSWASAARQRSGDADGHRAMNKVVRGQSKPANRVLTSRSLTTEPRMACPCGYLRRRSGVRTVTHCACRSRNLRAVPRRSRRRPRCADERSRGDVATRRAHRVPSPSRSAGHNAPECGATRCKLVRRRTGYAASAYASRLRSLVGLHPSSAGGTPAFDEMRTSAEERVAERERRLARSDPRRASTKQQ